MVGLFLVFLMFFGVLFWRGGQKTATGLQMVFLAGVETTTSFEGGVQKNNNGAAAFVSRMWQRQRLS